MEGKAFGRAPNDLDLPSAELLPERLLRQMPLARRGQAAVKGDPVSRGRRDAGEEHVGGRPRTHRVAGRRAGPDAIKLPDRFHGFTIAERGRAVQGKERVDGPREHA